MSGEARDDDRDVAVAATELAGSGDTPTAATTPSSMPVDAEASLAVGARLGDRYVVRALLGIGGMGAVYRVYDETLAEEVAIKNVHGATAGHSRLRDEVRLAQRVTHRNVCRTYDLEDVDGRHFVKMEYVAGETLATRLARSGRVPIDDAVRIARAIADGLAAAHAAGIVHRDLKPGNVMLAADRVVLMDFGLARRAQSHGEHDRAGTPGYMSPEQLAGRELDPRSDLFALGCVVYELVVGERPFSGEPTAPPPDPRARRPETPRWLARAIVQLLALDPTARTGGAVRLARGPRHFDLAVAIACALVVAAIAALWVARPGHAWRPEIVTIGPTYDDNVDSLRLSPDGRTLAFVSDRGGDWAAYTSSIDGGETRQVLPWSCWTVHWARDGRALFVQCRRDGEWRVYEVPQPRGEPIDRGPGGRGVPCGGALLIATLRGGVPFGIVQRWPDGHDTTLVAGDDEIDGLACDAAGERIAYTTAGRAWLIVRGERKRLDVDGASDPAFTPSGRSLVIVKRTGESADLFELDLDSGALHQITDGADAASPDVAHDGSTVVFDRDVTSRQLVAVSGTRRQRYGGALRALFELAPSSDGRYVVAYDDGAKKIVAIDVVGNTDRELADGRAPFVSHDGTRVLFAAGDDRRRLMAVPIAGGAAARVATLPGAIRRGYDARDGIHVEIAIGGATRAYVVGSDGVARDEGVVGLVIPAPSGGWRAVMVSDARGVVLRVVPPDRALADPAYELATTLGRPAWIDDRQLAYCTERACVRTDVATRAILDEATVDHAAEIAVAASGRSWFTVEPVAHVTRRKIINFASRPWAR